MQQLYLNNKRIDSILKLQEFIGATANNEKKRNAVCRELLIRHKNNELSAWFKRQPESRTMPSWTQALCTASARQQDVAQALAQITLLPTECFVLDLQNYSKLVEHKQSLLRTQDWWEEYESIFDALDISQWDFVILNQQQLNKALSQLQKPSQKLRTVYICQLQEQTGQWYSLDLRSVSNACFVGIGDPKVYYPPYAPAQTIDAKKQKLTFKNFSLQFFSRILLENYRECSTAFSCERKEKHHE